MGGKAKPGYLKEWKKRNPEKVKAYAKKYSKKHHAEIYARSMAWIRKNRKHHNERARINAAKRRMTELGMQKEAKAVKAYRQRREDELTRQAGRPRSENCELCGMVSKTVFDHCHEHGHFRGWICDRCNRVLGCVYDSQELLMKMIEYLERTKWPS